jgi:hypothetical protein
MSDFEYVQKYLINFKGFRLMETDDVTTVEIINNKINKAEELLAEASQLLPDGLELKVTVNKSVPKIESDNMPKRNFDDGRTVLQVTRAMLRRIGNSGNLNAQLFKQLNEKSDEELSHIMKGCRTPNENAITVYLYKWMRRNNVSRG